MDFLSLALVLKRNNLKYFSNDIINMNVERTKKYHDIWTLTLIRHGETDANKHDRFIGITDVPLNARGREQAHLTGRFLLKNNWKFDTIFVSPLHRAQETAEIIHSYIPCSFQTTPLLRERNYGIFENKQKKNLKKQFPTIFNSYHNEKPFFRLPNGESAEDVESRVHSLLFDVIPSGFPDSKHLCLITHLNPIRAILHLLGLMERDVYYRSFQHASITKIITDFKTSTIEMLDYSSY